MAGGFEHSPSLGSCFAVGALDRVPRELQRPIAS